MSGERNLARQHAAPERRPVAASALERSPAVQRAPSALQRLGNQGVSRFAAHVIQRQSKLEISSPHDPAEREAATVAAAVMRMPAAGATAPSVSSSPTLVQRCACGAGDASCRCGQVVQRAAAPLPKASAPAPAAKSPTPAPAPAPVTTVATDIQQSLSGGTPLPAPVRGFMEPRFGRDFGAVRIHHDERAARLSDDVHAHAFTVGNHIFFGRDRYQPDTSHGRELIAHELTHVLQQGASAAPAKVQRQEKSWWERFTDFTEDFGWGVVRRIAPSLEPILRGGVFEWLKSKATAAAERVFSVLSAPVQAIGDAGGKLSAFFAPLVVSVQAAAAKIAQNDCSPIREAAERIEQIALRIVTPIVETVQPIVAKVKEFIGDVWDTIGAPIWEWIQQYAAEQWRQVQQTIDLITAAAQWIWDKTATIRAIADRAWTWLKNQIGIGEGVEGQNGILQWVQRKLEAAWDWVKAKLEPFKREITTILAVVGGVLLAVSPAGPVLAVGAAIAGAVQGLRWIAANWGKGNVIVQARIYLEKTLFPQLTGAAQRLSAAIVSVAGAIGSALGGLASGLLRAAGAVASSLLSFLVSAVQWLANQAVKLAAWAQRELGQLAQWMTSALVAFQAFLKGVMEFLAKVAKVVINIWGLPVLLGEKVWNWVPACIRDPIVDFIGPIILRQIEIFQELAKDNEAWQKTKADIGNIIKLVFKDHDLMGAVKATFRLVLRVFNVPPELLTTIWQKAMAAWNVIIKKPLEFIKNTVRSIGHGFRLLWENLWDHLTFGLQGWLFGELAEKKITPPSSWTDPKAVFNFVLDVLGISIDHMWELLAKRFDETKVAKARLWFGRITGAIAWINKAIDTSKTPAENARGLVDQAKGFAGSILTGIAEWVAAKVAQELAIMAAAAAASGGLSEVIDILRRIYKAIVTAVRWARRILDMVNQTLDTVLDIAAGAVEKVGMKFEQIMRRGMPVVIGFLADQVGLGGVGQAIREIVDKLRAQVDAAILWVIDKIKAGLEAVIGLVQAGVAAVVDWWKARKKFRGADGEEHELFFEGREESAEMMIASNKKTVRQFLADYPKKDSDDYKLAKSVFDAETRIIYSTAGKTDQERAERKQLVESGLARISAAFARLAPDLPEEGDYPKSDTVTYPGGGKRAKHNVVEHLVGGPAPGGSPPEVQGPESDTPGWPRVLEWGLTKKPDKWVQMHVVSAALGGPGRGNNLIAAPSSINTGPFLQLELRTRDAATSREGKIRPVMWYDVKVRWRDDHFAESIHGKAGLWVWKGSKATPKWQKNETPTLESQVPLPRPDFRRQDKISLSFSGKTALRTVIPNRALVELIYENRTYNSYEHFKTTIRDAALKAQLGDVSAELNAIVNDDRIVVRDLPEP